MQLPLSKTHHYQSALAGYCRTGKYEPIPGVRSRHVVHYRRLVYNVVEDMLQSAFPLTHHLLSKKEWTTLIDEFFSHHPCQSPQVWYMPKELYLYIAGHEHPLLIKYPFLKELLLFEWMETELFMMDDKPVSYNSTGDLLSDWLILNPEHQLQYFQYPVHLKKAKQITIADKGDNYLVMFRDPETGRVQFMNISPALVRMVELLKEAPMNMETLTDRVGQELQVQITPDVSGMIRQFLTEALKNRLIIGFKATHY
jgi:uncharacterized protein